MVLCALAVLAVAVVMSLMSQDLWLFVLLVVASASATLGYSASALRVVGRARSCGSDGGEGVRAAMLGVAVRLEPDAVTAAKRLVEESTRDRWLVALAHDRLDSIEAPGRRSVRVFVGALMVGALFAAGAGSVTQHRGWAVTMVVCASAATAMRAARAARMSVGVRVLASLATSDAAARDHVRPVLDVPDESTVRRIRACAGTHVGVLVFAAAVGSGVPW